MRLYLFRSAPSLSPFQIEWLGECILEFGADFVRLLTAKTLGTMLRVNY